MAGSDESTTSEQQREDDRRRLDAFYEREDIKPLLALHASRVERLARLREINRGLRDDRARLMKAADDMFSAIRAFHIRDDRPAPPDDDGDDSLPPPPPTVRPPPAAAPKSAAAPAP